MKNVNTLKIVAAVALALGFGSAQAATITAVGSMGVSSTVSAACSVFTVAGGLAFGPYANNNATNVDASNTVSATCTLGSPYTMAISKGSNFGLGPWGGGYRALAGSGGGYLSYSVTQDNALGAMWGNGVDGSLGAVRSSTGTGAAQTFTYFGRIPALQAATVGSYSDTLVATLTY